MMETSMSANASLHKLIYCSRNCMSGTETMRESEIQQILDRSRANNSKASVTGALLFSSGFFAQALEGPRAEIERVFERIQRDTRHGDVTVLESSTCDARDFGEWSMAYVEPPTERLGTPLEELLREAMAHNAGAGQDVIELLRTLVLQEA